MAKMVRTIGTSRIPCAECDFSFDAGSIAELMAKPDMVFRIPNHRVCDTDCCRLVCNDHMDCVSKPFSESDSE